MGGWLCWLPARLYPQRTVDKEEIISVLSDLLSGLSGCGSRNCRVCVNKAGRIDKLAAALNLTKEERNRITPDHILKREKVQERCGQCKDFRESHILSRCGDQCSRFNPEYTGTYGREDLFSKAGE